MNIIEKKHQLMNIIKQELTSYIDNDYVFLDLPYYNNLGDTLIWEGTKCFLNTLSYKCLYSTDMHFYVKRTLPKNIIILLQGGGNFGDLYRDHTDFRKKIIETYPENRIIILPQSVYYDDNKLMQNDALFYASHKNVIICARDDYSYNFLKEHFKNKILLVPDMAFFINLNKYKIPQSKEKILFFKRSDKELDKGCQYNEVPTSADIHDWPIIEHDMIRYKLIDWAFYPIKFLFMMFGYKYRKLVEDFKRDKFYRKSYVQIGINFISRYSIVYTTRLHAMILAVLLNKTVILLENSTGKLGNFYSTWLTDLDNIRKINCE